MDVFIKTHLEIANHYIYIDLCLWTENTCNISIFYDEYYMYWTFHYPMGVHVKLGCKGHYAFSSKHLIGPTPRFIGVFVLLIFLVFCVCILFCCCFSSLCVLSSMLPVSLDCPFFIAPSAFSRVYLITLYNQDTSNKHLDTFNMHSDTSSLRRNTSNSG